MKKAVSVARPSLSRLVSSFAFEEAVEKAKEALECGCIDKIEEARDSFRAVLSDPEFARE